MTIRTGTEGTFVRNATLARLLVERGQEYRNKMSGDVTPFAKADFRDDDRVFGIKRNDRRYHLLTIGRTGTGKSTLLSNLIQADLDHGEGLGLIDPHGDLAATVLERMPDWRPDVLIFEPGSPDNDLTFNPLHVPRPDQRHLIVSELMTIFQTIWSRSWGSRLEYILRVVFLTLTERPGYTLLDALRILNDKDFRADIVEQIQEPILKRFWTQEFAQYSKGYRTEAIAPIQSKLGEFLINPVLKKVFEHPEGNINPREIMDKGQVFIADLSVGRVGRDVAMLLGATLLGKFGLAALSRSDQAPATRRPFYLYVDELPLFATSSIETILSESRKYGLAMTMAVQYLEALDPKLLAAVLGNVGNLVVFRVGAKDATILEREFIPTFNRDDLISLPYHHVYVRMMVDGKPAMPFSAKILNPDWRDEAA